MQTEKFNYDLPADLIAQEPAANRGDSRLLVYNRRSKALIDSRFSRLAEHLCSGDCLVLNDTRVLQARFFANRASGAKLEGLFISEREGGIWEVFLKGAGKVKPTEEILLKDRVGEVICPAEIIAKEDGGICIIRPLTEARLPEILDKIGFAPLPPYIKRPAPEAGADMDRVRYQTVYAKTPGAIAAPTAGLHFTEKLIEEIQAAGIHLAYITLHVGLGTFRPITEERLEEHQIHQEEYRIAKENSDLINKVKQQGGRIIPVGTTSVRALETSAGLGVLQPAEGHTRLFIRPGYEFRIIDGMITNFHLPKSTLLALVSAFAGLDEILAAYRYAVERRYRFYSYGDAMLII